VAIKSSPFGLQKDMQFMAKALEQARRAFNIEEVPIGAIVVDKEGQILARGYNLIEHRFTQAAHAEIIALSRAGKKLKDWRLEGCWLYVTLEPCAMCMNLCLLSRLAGVVFGTTSPLFGYQLDKKIAFRVYKKDTIHIIGGICADESVFLLKQFFQHKRKKKGMEKQWNNKNLKK
jgi:tRNA(adenine34) deaminase